MSVTMSTSQFWFFVFFVVEEQTLKKGEGLFGSQFEVIASSMVAGLVAEA